MELAYSSATSLSAKLGLKSSSVLSSSESSPSSSSRSSASRLTLAKYASGAPS